MFSHDFAGTAHDGFTKHLGIVDNLLETGLELPFY
jgi:hypothetical protein